MDNIWIYIGISLLAWVAWDLYEGYTLTWRMVYRDSEPTTYWVAIAVWTSLAISCFFTWGNDNK